MATLQRIRDNAALALPATDAPLDLSDHETWLLRQICIDYLPGHSSTTSRCQPTLPQSRCSTDDRPGRCWTSSWR